MIALVVGPPGSGKSYTSVSIITEALREGRYVATNVELVPDWPAQVVRTWPLWWLRGRGWRERKALELARRVFVSADLEELFRVRVVGCGSCSGCKAGMSCRREGRGVMVLDEAHNWMNARTWDADPTGQAATKTEAIARRLKVVRFFSQHRKLGWTVYLITQDEANIDRQVRSLFEYLIRLRNLRNFKVAGVPLVPVNVFLAIWTWNDAAASVAKRQARRLHKRVARLYDTMALSHGLGDDDEAAPIWLPVRSGDVPELPTSGEGGRSSRSGEPAPLTRLPADPDLLDPAGALAAAPVRSGAPRVDPAATRPDHAGNRPYGAGRASEPPEMPSQGRPVPPARFPSVPGVERPTTQNRPGWHPGGSNDQRQAGRDRGLRG